jgi:hypothetical protein
MAFSYALLYLAYEILLALFLLRILLLLTYSQAKTAASIASDAHQAALVARSEPFGSLSRCLSPGSSRRSRAKPEGESSAILPTVRINDSASPTSAAPYN